MEINDKQFAVLDKVKNYNGEIEQDCNGTIVINKENTNRFLFVDAEGNAKLRLVGNQRIVDRGINA